MRLLVLGGTAFLSASIVRSALGRGFEVTCLARGSERQPPPGSRFVAADRDAGPSAYAGLDGEWDAVVEVARQPRQVREALDALADRAAHWTFVSSGSVYAHHDDPPGLDESAAELLPAFVGDGPSTDATYGEAKVACEELSRAAVGDRLHVSRSGLIAGTGDPTDRFGYWPGRFARGGGSVLVPAARQDSTQVIGVADLTRWVLDAAVAGLSGTLNAYGSPLPFGEVIDLAARVAGFDGDQVSVDGSWLVEQKVEYWSGEESLPLWLPPDYTGFGARSNAAALAAGLRLSPMEDLMQECLAYEVELGLDRERRAGLSARREAELLSGWSARPRTGATSG